MLELAKCRECQEVKPCIAFRGRDKYGNLRVGYYCPECDELLDEWLDPEVQLELLPMLVTRD